MKAKRMRKGMTAKRRPPNRRECRLLATPATGQDRPDYQCNPGEKGCVGCIARGDRVKYRGLKFICGDVGELLSPDETETIYRPGQALPDGKDINRRGIWALVDRWLDLG